MLVGKDVSHSAMIRVGNSYEKKKKERKREEMGKGEEEGSVY